MPITYQGTVTEKSNGRIVVRPAPNDPSGIERIEVYADGLGHVSLPEMGDAVSLALDATLPASAPAPAAAPTVASAPAPRVVSVAVPVAAAAAPAPATPL